jgi:HlyD family secretion protein
MSTPLQPSTPRTHRHARRRVVRWVKRIALGVGSAGVIGALVYAWIPSPVLVDVATVKRAPLEVEIAEDGQTRVRDRFVVTAPIAGMLERLDLEVGDEVSLDRVIGHVRAPAATLLDPRSRDEATARLAAAIAHRKLADASIARATATRDQAIRDADRGRQLVAHDAIPIAERDRLELAERVAVADARSAELDRDAAKAEVDAARATLGDGNARDSAKSFPITSPVAGRVLKIARDSAGPVAAGAPLVELGDAHALEAVIDVLSADAAKIERDMPVKLGGWGGDHPITGRVRVVEPSGFTHISALGVEEQRVNVIVTLDDAPPALGDGFRVEARIVTWRGDTMIVPASAVFRDHDHWAVYTADAGIAKLVPVELGHRGRTDVEISAGLSPGSTVVLHPGERVVDGAKLAVRRQQGVE